MRRKRYKDLQKGETVYRSLGTVLHKNKRNAQKEINTLHCKTIVKAKLISHDFC